ncbi:unnamed protein product [Phytophthora lilii]|uniref:Unnamed protein product n=1 Tax=Phytophthora lilii TaxID=2077276 RepID=A0A9W6TNK8_9STRA|nr:unnamed protein product [Phytophthora lilii]
MVGTRNTAVIRINNSIRALDWNVVRASLLHTEGDPVEVRRVSLNDWNEYAASEKQALKATCLAWYNDRIWIVEYPGALHGTGTSLFEGMMYGALRDWEGRIGGHSNTHAEVLRLQLLTRDEWNLIAASGQTRALEQFYLTSCSGLSIIY